MKPADPPAGDAADNWFHRMQRGEVPAPPVARLLGARILRVDAGAGELSVQYQGRDEFANPAGSLQGGMLGAMLDDLTAGLVDSTLSDGEFVATLNLTLQFLRPARSGTLDGEARLQRRGRDVCHVEGRLSQNGQLVATATAVCLIVRPSAKPKPG